MKDPDFTPEDLTKFKNESEVTFAYQFGRINKMLSVNCNGNFKVYHNKKLVLETAFSNEATEKYKEIKQVMETKIILTKEDLILSSEFLEFIKQNRVVKMYELEDSDTHIHLVITCDFGKWTFTRFFQPPSIKIRKIKSVTDYSLISTIECFDIFMSGKYLKKIKQ